MRQVITEFSRERGRELRDLQFEPNWTERSFFWGKGSLEGESRLLQFEANCLSGPGHRAGNPAGLTIRSQSGAGPGSLLRGGKSGFAVSAIYNSKPIVQAFLAGGAMSENHPRNSKPIAYQASAPRGRPTIRTQSDGGPSPSLQGGSRECAVSDSPIYNWKPIVQAYLAGGAIGENHRAIRSQSRIRPRHRRGRPTIRTQSGGGPCRPQRRAREGLRARQTNNQYSDVKDQPGNGPSTDLPGKKPTHSKSARRRSPKQ